MNALSEQMDVEVAREKVLWKQSYVRGKPTTGLVNAGPVHNRRGTSIRFKPDQQIFPGLIFSPARLYRLCRSKAYLFRGVEIRWSCDPALLEPDGTVPAEESLRFPGGLSDYLASALKGHRTVTPAAFAGESVEVSNLAPSTILMISPTGKVSSMKMTDKMMMDMAMKEGTPLTGSVMLLMTDGKLYLMQDKMMPNGKMLSEFIFSPVN